MRPRFFVPELNEAGAAVRLPPDEAHHLVKVLRLRTGDEVAVFDGRGGEFEATVASISGGAVTVTLDRRAASVQPALALTLAQAVLKGEAMDSVVRDCTMAGVATLQPLTSANVAVRTSLLTRAPDRWGRVALASAKQCGRARLPVIHEPRPFAAWVAGADRGPAFLLVEPAHAGAGAATLRDIARQPGPPAAALIVGPEGGWTREEHTLAIEHGCVPLTLGPLTLRAAAVPLVTAAALLAIWESDSRPSPTAAPNPTSRNPEP